MSATQKTFLPAKNKGLIGILYICKSVIYHPHPLTTTTTTPSAKHIEHFYITSRNTNLAGVTNTPSSIDSSPPPRKNDQPLIS